MVSNVSGAYQNPQKPTGCSFPPRMSALPPTGVVVLFDVFLGGPMQIEQTLAQDTHFPLTMAMLRTSGGRRSASVTLHGSNRYSVEVGSGPRASASVSP